MTDETQEPKQEWVARESNQYFVKKKMNQKQAEQHIDNLARQDFEIIKAAYDSEILRLILGREIRYLEGLQIRIKKIEKGEKLPKPSIAESKLAKSFFGPLDKELKSFDKKSLPELPKLKEDQIKLQKRIDFLKELFKRKPLEEMMKKDPLIFTLLLLDCRNEKNALNQQIKKPDDLKAALKSIIESVKYISSSIEKSKTPEDYKSPEDYKEWQKINRPARERALEYAKKLDEELEIK